jgi:pimeloyl-ACP methyl ester carboxylesterase
LTCFLYKTYYPLIDLQAMSNIDARKENVMRMKPRTIWALMLIPLLIFGCEKSDSGDDAEGVATTDDGTPTDGATDDGTTTDDIATDSDSNPVDDGQQDAGEEPSVGQLLPVLFVHGTSGSASQFESQAQRFLANGYPKSYLAVFEYDTGPFAAAFSDVAAITKLLYDADFHARINAKIDQLLTDSGAEKVNLIGHSLGTLVCNAFMKTDNNAQRIARYVNVDGTDGQGTGTPFANVETLALWGMGNDDTNALGETATDDHDPTQSHIEVCTSATSFAKIYQFFNDKAPATTEIPKATGETVTIAGKANIFPENVGANGMTLNIYEVDPNTGFRVSASPIDDGWDISDNGDWGPLEVKKGAAYEFVLEHDTVADATHIFYREPFYADDYFVRLNTARPGEGLSAKLTHSADHTVMTIARDREMWGDQGDGNDLLLVNGEQVLTEEAAAQSRRLSSLFLSDENGSKSSDFTTIASVNEESFISGIDFYIEAASPPDQTTVSLELTPRGGNGAKQTINVPNWRSSEVRTVSVQFRDFVQK